MRTDKKTAVVIVGAGNVGRMLFDCLEGDERWSVVGFIDDGLAGGDCFGLPIFSSEAYDSKMTPNAFMALGFPNVRRAMVDRLRPLGLQWRTFVDRRSVVGRGASLGEGTIVLSFAFLASGVDVGAFTYVGGYAHAGAGAKIGAFSSLMPGSLVASSTVGEGCVLGPKSACLDGAIIGDGATIAPLALVRRVVPANALIAGAGARIVGRSES